MEILQKILSERDEDPFSGVLDAARELNVNLSLGKLICLISVIEKLRNNHNSDIPHMALLEKPVPYIYELLNSKRETFNPVSLLDSKYVIFNILM